MYSNMPYRIYKAVRSREHIEGIREKTEFAVRMKNERDMSWTIAPNYLRAKYLVEFSIDAAAEENILTEEDITNAVAYYLEREYGNEEENIDRIVTSLVRKFKQVLKKSIRKGNRVISIYLNDGSIIQNETLSLVAERMEKQSGQIGRDKRERIDNRINISYSQEELMTFKKKKDRIKEEKRVENYIRKELEIYFDL